jgi:exonuclease III
LSRNFDTFSNFWGNIDHKFSFIALSETWLQSSENSFEIPGYNFIHNHRHNRAGGGVGLYFSANLNYKVRKDLTYNNKSLSNAESLFIEILKPRGRGKNVIVGVVYRPPCQNINDSVIDRFHSRDRWPQWGGETIRKI